MALPHFQISTDQDRSAVGNINASRMPPKFFSISAFQALRESQHLFEKAVDGKAKR